MSSSKRFKTEKRLKYDNLGTRLAKIKFLHLDGLGFNADNLFILFGVMSNRLINIFACFLYPILVV